MAKDKKTRTVGAVIADTTRQGVSVFFNADDLKALNVDAKKVTTTEAINLIRPKLGLPERSAGSSARAEVKERQKSLAKKLGLPEDATKKAIYKKMYSLEVNKIK